MKQSYRLASKRALSQWLYLIRWIKGNSCLPCKVQQQKQQPFKGAQTMNVQERIARIDKLRDELESHCMCAEFMIRDNAYVVIYPPGYTDYQGIHHNLNKGKIHALEQLLKRCEDDWQASMFWK